MNYTRTDIYFYITMLAYFSALLIDTFGHIPAEFWLIAIGWIAFLVVDTTIQLVIRLRSSR